MRRALLLLLLAVSLAACGQKSALYLPDEPPQAIGVTDGTTQTDGATPTERNDEERKRIH
jgi:predicted small lipoprotein YifL